MLRKIGSFLIGITLFILCSCEASTNYSKQLEAEEKLINQWIKRNKMVVIDKLPKDTIFKSNELYHVEDGIYIQIIDKGQGEPLREGDALILRYRQSLLTENAVVIDYWTTQDRPYPNEITYGSTTNSCQGWQDAFDLMRRTGSHALVIVPSKLGMDDTDVTPYLYEMKIKIVPK